MKEYTEGVMLYKAEQTEVWNKTTVTDTALKMYFADNSRKFMFPERVNISEILFDSDTLAYMVYDSLQHGADFGELASRHNIDQDLKSKHGERGLLNAAIDEETKAASRLNIGQFSEPISLENGGFAIVKLIARQAAHQKSFEEAGAEVSNAYQDFESKRLEQVWVDRIKQKYPVMQYKEVLQEAFKSQKPAQ